MEPIQDHTEQSLRTILPGEDICKWHIGKRVSIQKYIENLNSTPKQKNLITNGQKTWTDISPKKTYRCPTNTWKDVHHHLPSGKYKSKLQWDITSHLSEWLKSATQKTIGVGKDVEKKEESCTVNVNANWCNNSEKEYRSSSKS